MNDTTGDGLRELELNEQILPEKDVNDQDIYPEGAIFEYEGWRRFVNNTSPSRPPIPSESEFERLTKEQRNVLRRQRILYHAQFGPLVTPTLKNIHDDTIKLASLNYRAAPGARMGVVLDGLGTVGKSTIVMNLGKKYEQQLRKLLNRPGELPSGHAFIPVAYISLPSNVTVKTFNARVVRYFNIPVRKSETEYDLSERILENASKCATSMFIIDDVHFLNVRTKHGTAVNDHLKYLASHISATFIYAGIDLAGRHFMSEGTSVEKSHLSQTQHRFRRYAIAPYKKESHDYTSLISSFEEHLLLVKQKRATLYATLGSYIHDRTDGFIGAISYLLRQGANLAIETGHEQLSQHLLDRIRLDDSAERYSRIAMRGGSRRHKQ